MNSAPLTSVPEALSRFKYGRTRFYSELKSGMLPPLVKFGRRSIMPTVELEAIIAARIAGKNDDEIRELVCQLIVKRTETYAALIGGNAAGAGTNLGKSAARA